MGLSRAQLNLQSMRLVLKEMHDTILYGAQHWGCGHGVLGLVQEIRVFDL